MFDVPDAPWIRNAGYEKEQYRSCTNCRYFDTCSTINKDEDDEDYEYYENMTKDEYENIAYNCWSWEEE